MVNFGVRKGNGKWYNNILNKKIKIKIQNCLEDSCTLEVTVIMKACARLVQTQARPHPSLERGAKLKLLPLALELLAIVSC